MLKMILLAIVAVIAGVLIYAATLPDTFQVQRSATIKATPEKIFPLVNDFNQWTAWSPWEHLDPAMKKTYSGAPAGVGAAYGWEGNKQVGKGKMAITESDPSKKIVLTLDFLEPFEAHNQVEFKFEPSGDSTKVSWIMTGPNPYIGKIMHVFMDMDSMLGKDFDTGLANLKALAEK